MYYTHINKIISIQNRKRQETNDTNVATQNLFEDIFWTSEILSPSVSILTCGVISFNGRSSLVNVK